MAGFATDAVIGLEARALARRVGGVATEAFGGGRRILEAETLGNRNAAGFAENPESAAMGSAGGRLFLPSHDLVLPDNRAIGFLPPVTSGSTARGHTEVGAIGNVGGCFNRGSAGHGRDEQGRSDQ